MMIAIYPMAIPAASLGGGAHLVTNAIAMIAGGAGIEIIGDRRMASHGLRRMAKSQAEWQSRSCV
jgi:hypothetical protein